MGTDGAGEREAPQAVRAAVHVCALRELPGLLRTIRRARGLTLKDVADTSGLHVGTVMRLESGSDDGFKTTTVERVLSALGVSLELLLRDAAGPRADTSQT